MIGDLVYELVQIPGPTGFEGRVANRLKELLKEHVDEVYIDKIGNLIAKKKGSEGKHSLALVAHTDQLSMVVQKVDEFVWFDKLGWIDLGNLPSIPVLILGAERDVPGVVRASTAHFAAGSEMPLWIDVGDRQKFVSVGDPIIFATPPQWLNDEKTILASHSIDDRVGCAIMVEVARKLTKRPKHDIYFVGSVQEEIGSQGVRHFLRQITPDWFIALDTGYAQDAVPDINKTFPFRTGLGVRRLSFAQPINRIYPAVVNFASPRLNQLLLDAAKKLNVPFHVDVATRTFSDHSIAYEANPEMDSTIMLAARRYGHSPNEVADLSNAKRAVDVLCQAIADMDNWDG
ncbi:MAG: M42 family metallopeptidase [Dehalococcoidales bacterium]